MIIRARGASATSTVKREVTTLHIGGNAEGSMECSLSIEYAQIFVRGMLLLTVSAAGMLCVVLGSKLYRDAVVSKTTGSLEVASLKMRFSAASPGIVLAGFGAYLLVAVAGHRFESESLVPVKPTTFRAAPSACGKGMLADTLLQQSSNEERGGFILTQAVAQGAASQPTPPPFTCALWKRRTVFASGESHVAASDLRLQIRSAIAVVEGAAALTPEAKRRKQEALLLLGNLRQLALDSIDAEAAGVPR